MSEKVVDFKESSGFDYDKNFKCLKGELSIKKEGRPNKFCS